MVVAVVRVRGMAAAVRGTEQRRQKRELRLYVLLVRMDDYCG